MRKLLLIILLLAPTSCNGCQHITDDQIHVVYSDDGKPRRWSQLHYPIRIDVDTSFSLEQLHAINSAAAEWEVAANRDLFLLYPEEMEHRLLQPESGHVSIIMNNSMSRPHVGAETELYGIKTRPEIMHSATMNLPNAVDIDEFHLMALHEFGHVLLVGHDKDKRSIMWIEAIESGREIQPKHVEFIQKRYGAFVEGPLF